MKSKNIDNSIKYLTLLSHLFLFLGIVSMDAHRRNECALVTICAHV